MLDMGSCPRSFFDANSYSISYSIWLYLHLSFNPNTNSNRLDLDRKELAKILDKTRVQNYLISSLKSEICS